MARDWLAAKPRGALWLQRPAVLARFVDASLRQTPLHKTSLLGCLCSLFGESPSTTLQRAA
jgi:hypothetical protein